MSKSTLDVGEVRVCGDVVGEGSGVKVVASILPVLCVSICRRTDPRNGRHYSHSYQQLPDRRVKQRKTEKNKKNYV